MGEYTLAVGKQQAVQNITEKSSASGNISYTDQENIYVYTPSLSGEYVVSLRNMVSEFYVSLYVYDPLGYKVGGSSILGNEDAVTVELTEGETYTIYLIQYSSSGSYDMNIIR